MADSLAIKVARLEQELLRSRIGLSAVPIVLQEEDTQAAATRIIVSAMRGNPEMQGALSPTAIFNVAVKAELKVLNEDASAALIDTYLREIDEANTGDQPITPSAGFATALAALTLFQHKDDDDTTQDDGENTRRLERTFTVMAKELDA